MNSAIARLAVALFWSSLHCRWCQGEVFHVSYLGATEIEREERYAAVYMALDKYLEDNHETTNLHGHDFK